MRSSNQIRLKNLSIHTYTYLESALKKNPKGLANEKWQRYFWFYHLLLNTRALHSSPGWMSQNHLPHSLKHGYWHKNRWFGPFFRFDTLRNKRQLHPSFAMISRWTAFCSANRCLRGVRQAKMLSFLALQYHQLRCKQRFAPRLTVNSDGPVASSMARILSPIFLWKFSHLICMFLTLGQKNLTIF